MLWVVTLMPSPLSRGGQQDAGIGLAADDRGIQIVPEILILFLIGGVVYIIILLIVGRVLHPQQIQHRGQLIPVQIGPQHQIGLGRIGLGGLASAPAEKPSAATRLARQSKTAIIRFSLIRYLISM